MNSSLVGLVVAVAIILVAILALEIRRRILPSELDSPNRSVKKLIEKSEKESHGK